MMSPPAKKLKAACKIAGVYPTTRELNGEDPTAFVLSANVHRRHMATRMDTAPNILLNNVGFARHG